MTEYCGTISESGEVKLLDGFDRISDGELMFSAEIENSKVIQIMLSRRRWNDAYLGYYFDPVIDVDRWDWDGSCEDQISSEEKRQVENSLDVLLEKLSELESPNA